MQDVLLQLEEKNPVIIIQKEKICNEKKYKLENQDCFDFLKTIQENSIDLILTDPPYTISKDTGFANVKNGVERFAVSMDFGNWDKAQIDLELMCKLFYKSLKKGGTAIVFYDLWKISYLAEAMQKAGFKMIRMIIWEKTNPVPLNSKVNYLTNAREIAILGIKDSKPTFKSEYDNGIYKYPIPRERRFHPTQKPLKLMEDLINKHSNINDIVLDPFMGSGTTGVGALKLNRKFIGCEINEGYFEKASKRIEEYNYEKTK